MDFKFLKNIILDRLHLTKYWRKKRKFNIGDYSYVSHNVKISKKIKIKYNSKLLKEIKFLRVI